MKVWVFGGGGLRVRAIIGGVELMRWFCGATDGRSFR